MASNFRLPSTGGGLTGFDASILVDVNGVIHELNAAAERLLRRANLASGSASGVIQWAWDELQREMGVRLSQRARQMVSIADPTGVRHCVIVIPDESTDNHHLSTIYMRDVVGLVVEQMRYAAALFRLSPSEHHLAESILLGRTTDMHAQLRGTAPSTVSKQLVGLFQKTGATRKHELPAIFQAVNAMWMPYDFHVSDLPLR